MDDTSFGPRLLGHFDFTLLFEHTIFHIGPSALILFATPFYIHRLIRGPVLIRPGRLLLGKLAAATALVAVQVANLVLWCSSDLDHLDLKLGRIAAVFSLLSAICITIITTSGHLNFLASSTFLGLFLTITLPADIVTTLTYHSRPGLVQIARLQIAVPVLKFVLMGLEEVSKRSLIHASNVRASLGGEGLAGFWNKSLLIWLNPLLLFGFRHKITSSSLPALASQFASDMLYREFESKWESRTRKTSRFALAIVLFLAIPWPFLYVLLPRLLVTGFTFSQPFLLQDIVNEVSTTNPSVDVEHGLLIATAIIYTGLAVSRSWYVYVKNQARICVRAVLASAIYHKSLRLDATELNKKAAVTLINTDLKGVDQLVELGYESTAYILEIGLGIAMLSRFVGAATIFALIPTILATVLILFVAKKMLATRRRWNEHIAARVETTSNMLAQSKDIKMMGLSPAFAMDLQERFEAETRASMKDRDYFTASLTLSAFGASVTPVLVVAGALFWSRSSEPMTASRFFTTLAFVQLVAQPLALFLEYIPYWSTGFAALCRIQEFLAIPERKDPRGFVLDPNSSSSISSEKGIKKRHVPGTHLAVEMLYVCVTSDFAGPILRGVCAGFPFGTVAMIFGPVGCGKTTMLSIVLGEARLSHGEVKLACDSLAYCSQVPWIQNITIRLNIIGQKPFDAAKYARVVYICALDEDFERMPDGDQTVAGTDGCNLSGGQKSRIALARTLYLEADIILLDDPFSSLDRETASTVRIRLFSESGLTEDGRTTVIMTTSNKAHLVDADLLFRIDTNGEVERAPLRTRELSPDSIMRRMAVQEESMSKASTNQAVDLPAVKPNDDSRDANGYDIRAGDFSLYSYFVGPAGTLKILFWSTLLVLSAVAERMPQIFGRVWMETDPTNDKYYAGYAIFGVVNPIMHVFSIGGFYHLVNAKAVNALHWALADTTSRATLEFLSEEDASFLLNRFSVDTSMATQTLPTTIITVVWCGLSVLIDVGVIASGASYASPIIPVFLLVVYLIQRFYLRTSRQLREMELDVSKLLTRHLVETTAGIEHIRAFRWQDALTHEFHEILDLTQKPFYFLISINQWLRSVMDLSTAACAVSIVGLALKFHNTASPASMGLSLLSLLYFSEIAAIFVRYYVNMEMAFGAVARIRAFMRNTPKEAQRDCAPVPDDWPPAGKLDFSCVGVAYKPDTEKPHKVFRNVSVTVQPGQTIGIIGRTGSGKSTLLLALLHLIEYSGTIHIDNREVKTVPRELLRSRITTITQGGLEITGSVRLNMDPFRLHASSSSSSHAVATTTATDDAGLADILRLVGLWAAVEEAGGLDAAVSRLRLSRGQRQLLQVARAVLHRRVTGSRVLLVDEATSSMDAEAEALVAQVIAAEFAGCTKVVVGHRRALLSRADVILRLNNAADPVVTRFEAGGSEADRERLWVHLS
ncbi:ABC transporter, transmembrane domain, type 1 [Cordyceps fumosorosea ARSEF 2679]|uniref:ABC transporter, transmembrane domain, type 1 n=1 Tax=Cordyceps fumosorosea (strain ARSEF 2679) TaxID=1081104 RepID=A0A168E2S4_CORFA|nr:ABC transporter, transmembrane domain, type 1 [Cordyceps fumosorosea ARSEF 2679]OAA73307.1 ABC transporter, transmembrane domain, type 1 [Cordyceps fumosorosea ARSEF 2679]